MGGFFVKVVVVVCVVVCVFVVVDCNGAGGRIMNASWNRSIEDNGGTVIEMIVVNNIASGALVIYAIIIVTWIVH